MRLSLRLFAVALFALFAAASAVGLHHMDSVPGLVLIVPGYLVQAWLFVRHRALGGLGCDLTMVGASAIFWTLLVVSVVVASQYVLRRFSR
jgi:hypothetical protein